MPDFLNDDAVRIFGKLTGEHGFQTLTPELKASWMSQITLLKSKLAGFTTGHLFFEFTIPRMGKRVDAILIYDDLVFVIEFKIGYEAYERSAIDQVTDYTIDLKNFHEGSHRATLIPILVVTNAPDRESVLRKHQDLTYDVVYANSNNLDSVLRFCLHAERGEPVDSEAWSRARYMPTPTIVEAAKALYAGHQVEEIARTDSDDVANLATTSDCIQQIIDEAYDSGHKSICFVTGVPGAGKTLAGLNIAIRNMETGQRHATYMSGNGPLVQVLREALSRDRWARNRIEIEAANDPTNPFGEVEALTLGQTHAWASTIIQAIHEFRSAQMAGETSPAERVVIFDESQRAWTREKLRSYLGAAVETEFDKSEPQFLIGEMDRHDGFSTIVCLVGGGQEIHDGEAGIEEWFRALREHFPNWKLFYSSAIEESNVYLSDTELKDWLRSNGHVRESLHLKMPIRSFRSDKVSDFVEAILDANSGAARDLYSQLQESGYPIALTREIGKAREWLRSVARGTDRIGLVASSGGGRLKAHGIFVKNKIKASDWFLKGKEDTRSSYFLEDVATEFDIQGLELDWIGVCWDGDLYFNDSTWTPQNFSGSTWKNVNTEIEQLYLKNTYRVLLTRARQGMIIFVPFGDDSDTTRPHHFYDGTFNFLKDIGLEVI